MPSSGQPHPTHDLRSFVDDKDRGRHYDIQHVQAWVLDRLRVGQEPIRESWKGLIGVAFAIHTGDVARLRLEELHHGAAPRYAGIHEFEAMRSGATSYAAALDLCAASAAARDVEDFGKSVNPKRWPGWTQAKSGPTVSALKDHVGTEQQELLALRHALMHRWPQVDQAIAMGGWPTEWGPIGTIQLDGYHPVPCSASQLDKYEAIAVDAYIAVAYLTAGGRCDSPPT